MSADLSASEKRALLERRNELLRAVLEITREQPSLMDGEDMDALLSSLARRQHLLDEMTAMKEQVTSWDLLERDSDCRSLNDTARAVLAEIRRQDMQNEKKALARSAELQERLRTLREGQTALRGYEKGADPGAVYFDKLK